MHIAVIIAYGKLQQIGQGNAPAALLHATMAANTKCLARSSKSCTVVFATNKARRTARRCPPRRPKTRCGVSAAASVVAGIRAHDAHHARAACRCGGSPMAGTHRVRAASTTAPARKGPKQSANLDPVRKLAQAIPSAWPWAHDSKAQLYRSPTLRFKNRRRKLCSVGGHIYRRQGSARGFMDDFVLVGKYSRDACRERNLSPVRAS